MKIEQSKSTATFRPESETDAFLLGLIHSKRDFLDSVVKLENGKLIELSLPVVKLVLALSVSKGTDKL